MASTIKDRIIGMLHASVIIFSTAAAFYFGFKFGAAEQYKLDKTEALRHYQEAHPEYFQSNPAPQKDMSCQISAFL